LCSGREWQPGFAMNEASLGSRAGAYSGSVTFLPI
jgi:hypothetical protein